MSIHPPSANDDTPDPTDRGNVDTLRSDTLADGVALVLGFAVMQRVVGFLRSMLFCRFLDEDELGRWSLAFSFLLLAAPLAVLGLTGSFGRYIEHYRQRGQLRGFLRRTSVATVVFCAIAVGVISVGHHFFAWIIFKDSQQTDLLFCVVGALFAMIAFNFFKEIFIALRQVRVASMMEFSSGMVFAVVSLALLFVTGRGTASIIVGYGMAMLLPCFWACVVLARTWRSLPTGPEPVSQRQMWSKLATFAGWVWVINLLSNLFDMADRYMIVHFSGLDPEKAVSLVGQYYSSLVIPMLMVAVSGMLGNMTLPYLSHDWEAGRRRAVSEHLNLALKLIGLTLFTVGAIILFCKPLLFDVAFAGKFAAGAAVLPWTVTYCIWISLSIVAHNYLWCAERARLGSVAIAIGLIFNVGLNWVLLPRYGLLGAVLATTVANGIALALVYEISRRLGMKFDRRIWVMSALPLAFCLGELPLMWILMTVHWLALRGNLFFSIKERQTLDTVVENYVAQIRGYFGRRATAMG